MKSLKIYSLVLLTALAFGLSSCLGDSDSDKSGGGIFEVVNTVGTTYFKVPGGTLKVIPSAASLSSVNFTATSGMAYITYTYTDDTSSTGSQNVTLTNAISLTNPTVMTTKGAANDSVSTNAIYSLDALSSTSSTSTEDRIYIYDQQYLLAAVNYYAYSFLAHTFTLVYYTDQTKVGDTTMNLYLRHTSKDSNTELALSSYYATYYPSIYLKSWDIYSFTAAFRAVTGSYPKTVTVHIPYSESTTDATFTDKTYSTSFSSSSTSN